MLVDFRSIRGVYKGFMGIPGGHRALQECSMSLSSLQGSQGVLEESKTFQRVSRAFKLMPVTFQRVSESFRDVFLGF